MRILLACLLLAACASEPPMPREKQGATESEFMQARDACMTESTMPFADATMGTYPASASSSSAQQAISCPKYDACMISRGFNRVASGRFYAPILCRD
ncbi:MAG TPA: hypothetical protein VF110_05230 [Burkholderiales bacterium]|jgi:hypothetical protein